MNFSLPQKYNNTSGVAIVNPSYAGNIHYFYNLNVTK